MSPENDTTLIITLTRTATLSSESTPSDNTYVSWKETTITTEQVISKAVTISPSSPNTSQEANTQGITAHATIPSPSTNLELRKSPSPLSSASSVITSVISGFPSSLQFGEIPTSSSTQVSIAVGVPMAIFVAFFIALGAWYYLRIQRSKREFDQNNLDIFSEKLNLLNQTLSKPGLEKLTKKPYPVVFCPTNYLHTDKAFQIYEQQKPKQTTNLKSQLNRLSGLWPRRDKKQESLTHPQPNIFKRISLMTPVFLRNFNTDNRYQGNKEVVKSPVLDISTTKVPSYNSSALNTRFGFGDVDRGHILSNKKMHTVIKPYTKSLDDELTIHIGDKCIVLEKFSDEWCKIQLHQKSGHELSDSDREIGLVPWMCLLKI